MTCVFTSPGRETRPPESTSPLPAPPSGVPWTQAGPQEDLLLPRSSGGPEILRTGDHPAWIQLKMVWKEANLYLCLFFFFTGIVQAARRREEGRRVGALPGIAGLTGRPGTRGEREATLLAGIQARLGFHSLVPRRTFLSLRTIDSNRRTF